LGVVVLISIDSYLLLKERRQHDRNLSSTSPKNADVHIMLYKAFGNEVFERKSSIMLTRKVVGALARTNWHSVHTKYGAMTSRILGLKMRLPKEATINAF
jgi:hypothetical protein